MAIIKKVQLQAVDQAHYVGIVTLQHHAADAHKPFIISGNIKLGNEVLQPYVSHEFYHFPDSNGNLQITLPAISQLLVPDGAYFEAVLMDEVDIKSSKPIAQQQAA